MSNKSIFKLSPRLYCCAKMVRNNSKIVDVGTDHAYLPIWLSKNNIISSAIACDINDKPLERARENINIYKVMNVETRISDGLENVGESEVDTIVIAGMGGELIYKIISRAEWTKNKILILQPMSSERDLRLSLIEGNYSIKREVAVNSDGRVYTVMEVMYDDCNENGKYDDLYPFVGKMLSDGNDITLDTIEYVKRQIKDIIKRKKGEEIKKNFVMVDYYNNVLGKLSDIIKKYNL